MIFDSLSKRIYVIGGQRGDRSLSNMSVLGIYYRLCERMYSPPGPSRFTYSVQTGAISEMTTADRAPRPKPIQMLRATADETSREIYACVPNSHFRYFLNQFTHALCSIASLASTFRSNGLGEPPLSQNQTTLWIYSMDENTWTPIIEPVHRIDVSWDNEIGSRDGDREPRPRLGHSVVLDPGRQTFYIFGGNSGEGRRMDDFWALSLVR